LYRLAYTQTQYIMLWCEYCWYLEHIIVCKTSDEWSVGDETTFQCHLAVKRGTVQRGTVHRGGLVHIIKL